MTYQVCSCLGDTASADPHCPIHGKQPASVTTTASTEAEEQERPQELEGYGHAIYGGYPDAPKGLSRTQKTVQREVKEATAALEAENRQLREQLDSLTLEREESREVVAALREQLEASLAQERAAIEAANLFHRDLDAALEQVKELRELADKMRQWLRNAFGEEGPQTLELSAWCVEFDVLKADSLSTGEK